MVSISVRSASVALGGPLAQPAAAITAAQPSAARNPAEARTASAIGGPPLRAVLEAEVHQALEQLAVGGAGRARGLGEVLGGLEIGIGVGLEHVHLPLGINPEVHASIAGEAERPV